MGQKRTHAAQQKDRCSIISSALESSVERHGEAELFRSFQIDNQFKFPRSLKFARRERCPLADTHDALAALHPGCQPALTLPLDRRPTPKSKYRLAVLSNGAAYLKIFITGASGYIGGSVAASLMAAGHQVTGLARSERGRRGAGEAWHQTGARHARRRQDSGRDRAQCRR